MVKRKQPAKKKDGQESEDELSPLDYAEVFSTLSYWYHMSYSDIKRMPHSAIEAYMENIQRNHAALRMMLGEATRLPHFSSEGFDDWVADIREKMNQGKPKRTPVVSAAIMKIVGIGIRK